MTWITPIWQRTKADVDRALRLNYKINKDGWEALTQAEKAEWMSGLIGMLNHTDLNRIEGNAEYIMEQLLSCGYGTAGLTFKADRVMADMPTVPEMERLRANVQKLVDVYHPVGVVVPAQFIRPKHTEVNDIENVLRLLKDFIALMEESYRRSGTFASGQSRGESL